jgi:thiamine biosynthesis protein ThiS
VNQIRVTVNGQTQQLAGETSLLGLLQKLELDPRLVVVEHNRRIVRRSDLEVTSVVDGDAVEVVHFVGGG